MKQDQLFDDLPLDALPVPSARRPSEPIIRTADLKPPYRWSLKRAWGGGPQIAWAMLNPSTADGLKDDPTMWRVMEFSMAWGFGSCVVVNVYPFQASKPADMKAWRKGFDLTAACIGTDQWYAWNDNIATCAELLTGADRRVAAWGAGADPQDVAYWLEGIHLERAGDDYDVCHEPPDGETSIMEIGVPIRDWCCLGTTKDGAPKHPLARGKERVPSNFTPVPWAFPQ